METNSGDNWGMKHARLLIALFLLATVLVDLVALSLVGGHRWPHRAAVVPFALMFTQVSLAAIWAALGKLSLPWRLARYC